MEDYAAFFLTILALAGAYAMGFANSYVGDADVAAQVTTGQIVSQGVTTGPPVVKNGELDEHRFDTIIPGIGSGYIVWTFTNESKTEDIRCEYGGIAGEPPKREPTRDTGSLIGPRVSLTERTAPSNRLDCIAVDGRPKYDITLYPK